MYLVDTNVISAAAPSRPVSPALIEWMDTYSASLFLSAVTVAEIEDAIAKSRREGATRKSADLSAWLETVLHLLWRSRSCFRCGDSRRQVDARL